MQANRQNNTLRTAKECCALLQQCDRNDAKKRGHHCHDETECACLGERRMVALTDDNSWFNATGRSLPFQGCLPTGGQPMLRAPAHTNNHNWAFTGHNSVYGKLRLPQQRLVD